MSSDLAHQEFDRYFSTQDHLKSHPEDLDHHSDQDPTLEKDSAHSPDLHDDDAEGSDEDILHDQNRGRMATATTTYTLPSTLFDANTGPKGVIADAASFERAKKKSFRRTLINVATSAYPFSRSPPKEEKERRSESAERSDEEEEFMRQWRENRLRELQAHSIGTRRASPSKRRFGSLDDVDAIGYLDAVEKLPPDTIVVVCLYDPESSISDQVESSLSILARRYLTTRFIKLHHEIAEMDHIGVPAILAYKAGDVFATIVNIRPEQRDHDGLEELLKKQQVLF